MMDKKQLVTQLDNPTHNDIRKGRVKALQLLEQVKSRNQTAVLLPRGYSLEYEKLKQQQLSKKKL